MRFVVEELVEVCGLLAILRYLREGRDKNEEKKNVRGPGTVLLQPAMPLGGGTAVALLGAHGCATACCSCNTLCR